MSFGPSQSVKNAQNTQNGLTNVAETNSANANALGTSAFNAGTPSVASGTNFLQTILQGNGANTASLLAPTINQNRATNQQTLQALSTLTPRGGGRSGTLFNAAFQPSVNTQDMFNNARTTAATALPQIGLAEQAVGTNLFNIGNAALNTGATSANNSVQNALQVQQMSNSLASGLGGGLFNLLTTPLTGGGTTALGSLFGLGGNSGSNPIVSV